MDGDFSWGRSHEEEKFSTQLETLSQVGSGESFRISESSITTKKNHRIHAKLNYLWRSDLHASIHTQQVGVGW